MIKIMRTCHGYSLTSTGSPPAILCDLLARPHLQLASEEPASFIIIKFPHNQAMVDCFRKDAIYHNLSRNGWLLCFCEEKTRKFCRLQIRSGAPECKTTRHRDFEEITWRHALAIHPGTVSIAPPMTISLKPKGLIFNARFTKKSKG